LAIMRVGQIDWYRVWITGVNGFEMEMPKWSTTEGLMGILFDQ
jgi:hypothetical protein